MVLDLTVEVDVTNVLPESAFLCEGDKCRGSYLGLVYLGHEKTERNNAIASR